MAPGIQDVLLQFLERLRRTDLALQQTVLVNLIHQDAVGAAQWVLQQNIGSVLLPCGYELLLGDGVTGQVDLGDQVAGNPLTFSLNLGVLARTGFSEEFLHL